MEVLGRLAGLPNIFSWLARSWVLESTDIWELFNGFLTLVTFDFRNILSLKLWDHSKEEQKIHALHPPASIYTFFEIFSCFRVVQFIDSFLKSLYNFVWSKPTLNQFVPLFWIFSTITYQNWSSNCKFLNGTTHEIMLFPQRYAATLPFYRNVFCQ